MSEPLPSRLSQESSDVSPGRVDIPRDDSRPAFAVVLLAAGLFSTFLSPQMAMAGRGLRTAVPLFLLFFGLAVFFRPGIISRPLPHFPAIASGLAFIGAGVVRQILDPQPDYLHRLVVSPATCVALWLAILLLREEFPGSVEAVRWACLAILGLSLGMGIPLLIREPGIARMTMGNPEAGLFAARLFPRGVTNYSWYTPAAIAFPVIANWLFARRRGRTGRMIGWGLLLASSAAVLLSTFTMAAILLAVGLLFWLALLLIKERKGRTAAAIVLAAIVILLPTLLILGRQVGGTAFIINKATDLAQGILREGILAGDSTGRTRMFAETMRTFGRNPVFGSWGLESGAFVGGHSSWADTLALQGLPVMALWLAFLSPSWRRRRPVLSAAQGTAGGTMSWVLLAAGGVLNNTLTSEIGLILIWLFDEGGWEQRSSKPRLE